MQHIACDQIGNRAGLGVGRGELNERIGPELSTLQLVMHIVTNIGVEDIQKACGVAGILANNVMTELKNIHKQPHRYCVSFFRPAERKNAGARWATRK
jgi:hypothetical protein